MPLADQHEEEKVQRALKLLYENPGMKIATAVRQTRAIYDRVRRRLKGIPRSSARGGHNKKLNVPLTAALKDYLIMCHSIGRSSQARPKDRGLAGQKPTKFGILPVVRVAAL
jgi:hypothetical protein